MDVVQLTERRLSGRLVEPGVLGDQPAEGVLDRVDHLRRLRLLRLGKVVVDEKATEGKRNTIVSKRLTGLRSVGHLLHALGGLVEGKEEAAKGFGRVGPQGGNNAPANVVGQRTVGRLQRGDNGHRLDGEVHVGDDQLVGGLGGGRVAEGFHGGNENVAQKVKFRAIGKLFEGQEVVERFRVALVFDREFRASQS